MADKHYTKKEKRQAEHIKESEREAGRSEEDAERIAYATVNKYKEQHNEHGAKKHDRRDDDRHK